MKPGRNDPCPCGSGKKYKQCCGAATQAPAAQPAPAANAEPSNAEKNQLIALYQAGRHADVEQGAGRLAQRYPQCGFLWKILAAALQGQGKDALNAYEQAARYLPEDAPVQNNFGDLLFKQGQYAEAEQYFLKALRLQPDYGDAAHNLGRTLLKQYRYPAAEQVFRRLVQLAPEDGAACSGLGASLRELNQLEEAEKWLRKALGLTPRDAGCLAELGVLVGARLHRTDEARQYFEQAIAIDPSYAPAYVGQGRNWLDEGDTAKAIPCFRQALALEPNSINALYWLVSNKKIQADDPDFAILLKIQEDVVGGRRSLQGEEEVSYHMALGKCLDQTGDVEQAVVHYLAGCKLKRATQQYDADQHAADIDTLIRIVDESFINRLRGAGNLSDKPIFVVGMPRSGTTLTEQIIAAHSQVHGAGELGDVLRITTQPLAGAAYPQSLSHLDQATLTAWGDDYLQAIFRIAPDAAHVSDKMPHNFTAVGLIHLMLPNAKIIHIKRHPVDTCISCLTTMFAAGLPWSNDLTELGRHYSDYARLMAHWKRVLPEGAFLEVQYEDLVQDTEGQARRIIEYCGLDWEEGCLEFYKNKRVVGTASMTQATRPIYKSSVERWRKYQPYLGPLLAELGDLVPTAGEVG
jgi:tetratricopeptide (TPR) repeat protein